MDASDQERPSQSVVTKSLQSRFIDYKERIQIKISATTRKYTYSESPQ